MYSVFHNFLKKIIRHKSRVTNDRVMKIRFIEKEKENILGYATICHKQERKGDAEPKNICPTCSPLKALLNMTFKIVDIAFILDDPLNLPSDDCLQCSNGESVAGVDYL